MRVNFLLYSTLIILLSSFISDKHGFHSIQSEKIIISKGKVGELKIGMTLADGRALMKEYDEKSYDSNTFGIGGGSTAYFYSQNGDGILALIPNSNGEVKYIQVFSTNYQTSSGIKPNSSLGDLLKVYPDLELKSNLMTNNEYFKDVENNFSFVFMTNEFGNERESNSSEVNGNQIDNSEKIDYIQVQ